MYPVFFSEIYKVFGRSLKVSCQKFLIRGRSLSLWTKDCLLSYLLMELAAKIRKVQNVGRKFKRGENCEQHL